jgi:hypothetical protein
LKGSEKFFADVISRNVDGGDIRPIGRNLQSHIGMPDGRNVTNQAPKPEWEKKRARRQKSSPTNIETFSNLEPRLFRVHPVSGSGNG